MNGINKIEQGRADAAFRAVKDFVSENRSNKKLLGEYRAHSKKIPMMIKVNGLAATFAFMNTKKDEDAHVVIGKEIIAWLRTTDSDLDTSLNGDDSIKLNGAIEYLLSTSSDNYRLLTNETFAYINWHRRFAEGMIKE